MNYQSFVDNIFEKSNKIEDLGFFSKENFQNSILNPEQYEWNYEYNFNFTIDDKLIDLGEKIVNSQNVIENKKTFKNYLDLNTIECSFMKKNYDINDINKCFFQNTFFKITTNNFKLFSSNKKILRKTEENVIKICPQKLLATIHYQKKKLDSYKNLIFDRFISSLYYKIQERKKINIDLNSFSDKIYQSIDFSWISSWLKLLSYFENYFNNLLNGLITDINFNLIKKIEKKDFSILLLDPFSQTDLASFINIDNKLVYKNASICTDYKISNYEFFSLPLEIEPDKNKKDIYLKSNFKIEKSIFAYLPLFWLPISIILEFLFLYYRSRRKNLWFN